MAKDISNIDCAEILLQKTIQSLNNKIRARLKASNYTNYAEVFSDIIKGFVRKENEIEIFRSFEDQRPLYMRMEPITLLCYNNYLGNIVECFEDGSNVYNAIQYANGLLPFYIFRLYDGYTNQSTIKAVDLSRGLEYLTNEYIPHNTNLKPEDVKVFDSGEVIRKRVELESERLQTRLKKKAMKDKEKFVEETLGGETTATRIPVSPPKKELFAAYPTNLLDNYGNKVYQTSKGNFVYKDFSPVKTDLYAVDEFGKPIGFSISFTDQANEDEPNM